MKERDHVIICCIIRILALSIISINRNRCHNNAQQYCQYCSQPSLHNLFPSFLIFFLQQMNFCICCMCSHKALSRMLLLHSSMIHLFVLFCPDMKKDFHRKFSLSTDKNLLFSFCIYNIRYIFSVDSI